MLRSPDERPWARQRHRISSNETWLGILFANIEDRKIYNTRMYSQSNTGHEFTDVLKDRERTAIIEYLKPL